MIETLEPRLKYLIIIIIIIMIIITIIFVMKMTTKIH